MFFSRIRTLFGPIVGFLAAGGLLTTGWYGFLQAIAAGMISLFLPALGLSVISAAWWFPFVRWGYRKYVFPLAPGMLPQPDSLKYAFNPPSLIKAALAVGVWFYTPLVLNSYVRLVWNALKSTPAPINDEALNFTDRQFTKSEKGEPLESSHGIPMPLQNVAEKVVDEIKQAKTKAEKAYGAAASSSSTSSSNKNNTNVRTGEGEEKADDDINKRTQENVDDEKDDDINDKSSIRTRNKQSSSTSFDKNKPGYQQENIKASAPSALYSQ